MPVNDSDCYTVSRLGMEDLNLISIETMNNSNDSSISSEYKKHSCILKSSDLFGGKSSKGASPHIALKKRGLMISAKPLAVILDLQFLMRAIKS